jgi:hypothetical protein
MVIAYAGVLVISWSCFPIVSVFMFICITNDSSSSDVHVIQASEIYKLRWCDVSDVKEVWGCFCCANLVCNLKKF